MRDTRPESSRNNSKATAHSPAPDTLTVPGGGGETGPKSLRPTTTRSSRLAEQDLANYENIIVSPPEEDLQSQPPSLRLPDPALDPADNSMSQPQQWGQYDNNPKDQEKHSDQPPIQEQRDHHDRVIPTPETTRRARFWPPPQGQTVKKAPSSFFKRVFVPKTDRDSPVTQPPAGAIMELRLREDEFFKFLDGELEKVESFYQLKENEASERLDVLRDQLHIMRDSKQEEILEKDGHFKRSENEASTANGSSTSSRWRRPLEGTMGAKPRYGKTSKAMQQLATPSGPTARSRDEIDVRRDFIRRHDFREVPYRSAKRKLKVALLEYYRGLELLKSYADMNRTAFRKMNKKYDKVIHSSLSYKYFADKVSPAWFVQSQVVENHIVMVEDLYARYFERGNHKIAVRKLRGKNHRSEDYSQNTFRNGLMFAVGLVLGIEGLVYGVKNLSHDDDDIRSHTSYLLQVSQLLKKIFFFFC